ncbi:MAG: phosphate ABC transporter permease PstA [Coriobacteriia bacterium]|nr:phosphate ABC transporter permease PstA [Coriobacteriia bacterium]
MRQPRQALIGQVRRARIAEVAARVLLAVCLFCAAVPPILVIGVIVWRGLPAISLEFIFDMPKQSMTAGGIFPAIVGTALLTLATALFAVPAGIAAGIYLAEYAGDSLLARLIRLSIANMAGVPSIVYGLFGLAAFVITMHLRQSILSGALTLACLSLPAIITATEEALRQVPSELRNAALALGATKFQTITRVILPAAAPGAVTGVILGLSRAAGETAPIIVTAAAFYAPLPTGLMDKTMVLPYHLYIMATQAVRSNNNVVWGTALVLVASTMGAAMAAAAWRSAQRRKLRW